MNGLRGLGLIVAMAVGCGADPPSEDEASTDDGRPALPYDSALVEPVRCSTPPGVSGRPRSIAEAVELINALPRPVNVPCVVQALQRPLFIVSTTSPFSAQPAQGARSPRIFLMSDALILSIATDGDGAHLLEFAEFISPTKTIKAELDFPLEHMVHIEDPFAQVLDDDATVCRGCHRNERAAADIYPSAFSSDALAPEPSTLVPLDEVRAERSTCDAGEEPDRCAILSALFDHGEVEPHTFPDNLPTIFDYE